MINQFAKQLINILTSKTKQSVDSDQLEVYIYGLECLINTAVPVILFTVFSFFTSTVFETWLWIITFSFLRKYTGGYHASSQLSCMASSMCLGMVNTILIIHYTLHRSAIVICYVIFATLILLFCPIESTKKTLTASRQKQYKYFTLLLITALSLLSLYLPETYAMTLIYSVFSCLFLVLLEVLHRINCHLR